MTKNGITTFGIEDIFPNISKIGANPLPELKEVYIASIPQYLFNSTLLEVKQEEIVRNIWLIRKYHFSIHCYKQAFKAFNDHFSSGKKEEFGFYFAALEWIEQLICSEYQFASYDSNSLLYPKTDTSSKYFRLNMCYNSIKHYDKKLINSEIFHRNYITENGFTNQKEILTYDEIYEVFIENGEKLLNRIG